MGDMADMMFDNIFAQESLHDSGMCDGFCQLCFNEMTPEEQKIYLKELKELEATDE